MLASQLYRLPISTPRSTSHKAPSNLLLTLLVNTSLFPQTQPLTLLLPYPFRAQTAVYSTSPNTSPQTGSHSLSFQPPPELGPAPASSGTETSETRALTPHLALFRRPGRPGLAALESQHRRRLPPPRLLPAQQLAASARQRPLLHLLSGGLLRAGRLPRSRARPHPPGARGATLLRPVPRPRVAAQCSEVCVPRAAGALGALGIPGGGVPAHQGRPALHQHGWHRPPAPRAQYCLLWSFRSVENFRKKKK